MKNLLLVWLVVLTLILPQAVLATDASVHLLKDGVVYAFTIDPQESIQQVGRWIGEFRDPKFYGLQQSNPLSDEVLSSRDSSEVLIVSQDKGSFEGKELRCSFASRRCVPSTLLRTAQQVLTRQKVGLVELTKFFGVEKKELPPYKIELGRVHWTEWDATSQRLFGLTGLDTGGDVRGVVFDPSKKRASVTSKLLADVTVADPSPSFRHLVFITYQRGQKSTLFLYDVTKLQRPLRQYDLQLSLDQPSIEVSPDAVPDIVAWNRDESMIALASATDLYTVDLRTGVLQKRYQAAQGATFAFDLPASFDSRSHATGLQFANMSFSSDGRHLFFIEKSSTGDENASLTGATLVLKVLNLEQGDEVRTTSVSGHDVRLLPPHVRNQSITAEWSTGGSPKNEATARDARRLSDVRQIEGALELYFLGRQQYPNAPREGTRLDGGCLSKGKGIEAHCSESGAGTVFLQKFPSAPTPPMGEYRYFAYTSDKPSNAPGAACDELKVCRSYGITVRLETNVSGLSSGVHCLTRVGFEDGLCPVSKK